MFMIAAVYLVGTYTYTGRVYPRRLFTMHEVVLAQLLCAIPVVGLVEFVYLFLLYRGWYCDGECYVSNATIKEILDKIFGIKQ